MSPSSSPTTRRVTDKDAAGHIPPSGKRHLFRLFPLLSQCVAAAQGDQEILGWLAKAMDEIGGALGVS